MRLSNILWLQRNKILILFLCLAISLVTILPVIKEGTNSIFYSVDPDVIYTSNSLFYYKEGYITYNDHPGTPAIIFYATILNLLRIYSKLIANVPFLHWVFINFQIVFLYLRIWQSLILFSLLLIFSLSIYSLTKKLLPVLLFLSLLLIFAPFYNLGSSISGDTFALLLISIWSAIFSNYLMDMKRANLFFLSLVAGLCFAERATTFFILPATFIPILLLKSEIKEKIIFAALSLINLISGFVIGVFPIKAGPLSVIQNLFRYANNTEVHVGGKNVFFDWTSYFASAKSYYINSCIPVLIFLSFFIIALVGLLKLENKFRAMSYVLIIFACGAFVFAKFPLAHYELTNYFMVMFIGSIIVYSIFNKYLVFAFFILVTLFIRPSVINYFLQIDKFQTESAIIQEYANKYPSKVAEVWQWSRSKGFALMWARDYSPGIFEKDIRNYRPNLYELINISTAREFNSVDVDLSKICWDRLYIQDQLLSSFILSNPEYKNSIIHVKGTEMNLIISTKCLSGNKKVK